MESPQLHCILNSNNVACSFAVVASFLAFLSCLAFLVLDTQETHIADTRFKTAFQLLDLILAGKPPGPPTQSCPSSCSQPSWLPRASRAQPFSQPPP